MQRKKNGDGYTYPFREGCRTVLEVKGIAFSATGRTEAELKRKTKEKVKRSERLSWNASPVQNVFPVARSRAILFSPLTFSHGSTRFAAGVNHRKRPRNCLGQGA